MPRKPIRFASDDRLSAVEHLAPRFFADVMDFDYDNCMITDESCIGDFVSNADGQGRAKVLAMLDRVAEHYFVDVRHLETDNIVELLEYLDRHGVTG